MRARLAAVTIVTTFIAIVLFAIPLSIYVRHTYYSGLDNDAIYEARSAGESLRIDEDARHGDFTQWLRSVSTAEVPIRITLPSGSTLGHDFSCLPESPTPADREGIETCGDYRIASANVDLTGVGRVQLSAGISTVATNTAWYRIVAIIAFGALTLPVLAALIADRLVRTVVRSVTGLVEVSNRLRDGDLSARAELTGSREMRTLGRAFNSLAERIKTMLADERESVADVSHRLRTPITSLMLRAEGLSDPHESQRIMAAAHSLNEEVTRIIRHAQQPSSIQTGGDCTLDEVVAERIEFWSALAEEQGRTLDVVFSDTDCSVSVPRDELETVIDTLIENVFSHTPDHCGIWVRVHKNSDQFCVLTVEDEGPGFLSAESIKRGHSSGGSSGLGLDIVNKTALAAGGTMAVSSRNPTGAKVIVTFSAAGTHRKQR